jgi:hypothetical protein
MPHDDLMNIHHPDYDFTIDEVKTVRDCVEGSNAIKNGERSRIYLPNPTDIDILRGQDFVEASNRYKAYKNRAEYSDFPSRTESGYMGAMKSTPPDFAEIPAEIEYLLTNSDGDNLTLSESIEITQANLLEVKFHGLLVDFNGLTQVDINDDSPQLTNAQAKSLDLKATIKHYPRESIVDWDYSVINNQNQLSFIKLMEKTSEIDRDTLQRVEVENQLVLALDENGEYYQQQITKTAEGKDQISDRLYPENNSGRLSLIPLEIVIDQKQKSSSIPKALGILYPICLKALSRYTVSADLKESIHRSAQPTMWSSGWTNQAFEIYKNLTGNEHIATGASSHIPLPKDASIGYLQWDADSNAMFKYMEENQKEAKALGARFDTSDPKDEAVGVAKIRSAEELSALMNIQSSIEESYTRVLGWCFNFMSTSATDPKIEIVLNKEFNKIKLTPGEQKAILDNFTMGLIDRAEALAQLEKGGVLISEAEELLNRSETNGE